MTKPRLTLGIGLVLLLAAPPVALADVGSDIQAELQAAGLPNVAVVVSTPPAATAIDAQNFEAENDQATPSITPENALSLNPSAPFPVVRVSFGRTTATRLPGIIDPPGGGAWWYALEDADYPLWRLQIMSALKHQLARGQLLAGVAMQPTSPNRAETSGPDLYISPPDPAVFPPTPLTQTMPSTTAQQTIKNGLPTWTALGASVQVADWVGGERRATVTVSLDPRQAIAAGFASLTGYMLDKQLELNAQGANIGSVVVKASSPLGVPLYTFAGDAVWGQRFGWMSPLVRAYLSNKPLRAKPAVPSTGEAQARANEVLANPSQAAQQGAENASGSASDPTIDDLTQRAQDEASKASDPDGALDRVVRDVEDNTP